MYETIHYESVDNVLTITLNRPERLNAFTPQMRDELLDALERADADDDIRAIVFTGAGRSFCAGADLAGGGSTFGDGVDDDYRGRSDDGAADRFAGRDGGGTLTLRLFDCRKPLIAAINGPAVGIGITMTLPMNIRLVADGARIGFVFARRGIVAEAASSWFLPRLVGPQQAMRHCASLPDVKEGIESFLEKRPPQFSARPSRDMPAFYPWWDDAPFGPPGNG